VGLSLSAQRLHAATPDVVTASRVLRFLRSRDGEHARLLTTRIVAAPLTRSSRAFGARRLENPATGHADALNTTALSGATLKLHTADGDVTLSFSDAAGRPLWAQNAQGTVTVVAYEPASAAGRPMALTEQPAGGTARVRERYAYALASEDQWRAKNLAGAMTDIRNNAGISRPMRVSLTGQNLQAAQQLLKPAVGLPDWEVTTEGDTEEALTVSATYDATGAPLTTTNAANVSTVTVYDISGSAQETRLRYAGKGADVVTLRAIQRRADGTVLSQTAGNDVVEAYEYDRHTHYLARHTTARLDDHPSGALLIIDLHYAYDPVGNILTLEDKGADPQWHNNQQATGLREYTYDTLYRLNTATGRERTPVARYSDDLTGGDVWTPYSEAYTYDDGDNLTVISHMGGAGNRRRELSVAAGSNRATLKAHGLTPETGFLAGGLQKQLSDGRPLSWYADNQLHQVSPVIRADGIGDDTEAYHYADGGTRTRKVHTVTVSGGTQITITTYAGGCEVRQRLLSGQATPQKHVVITEGGGVRVVEDRLLLKSHLRYSFSDHLGSSCGEMDDAGRITSREAYAPYGGTVGSDEEAGEVSNLMQRTYRYSGKEKDATGLIYYGWRYYQPELGRWLSADPGGLIDGLSLFRFSRNSPAQMFDADGRAPIDALKKSLKHAESNFKKNQTPGDDQQDFDLSTMGRLIESENSRKGKRGGEAPETIEYYSNVKSFVSKLIKDQASTTPLHYQAIVHMMPPSNDAGHFTAFDIYKPAHARRVTLINVESVEGMILNSRGQYVTGRNGIGLGLRDLYKEVERSIRTIKSRPLILIYETNAQKSDSDCAMFSIVNARAMKEFADGFMDTHQQFAEHMSHTDTPDFITPGPLSDLIDISPKFFKYSHSNTVLNSLPASGATKNSGPEYVRRNEKNKLRIKRDGREMNVGIDRKRISILKHAKAHFKKR